MKPRQRSIATAMVAVIIAAFGLAIGRIAYPFMPELPIVFASAGLILHAAGRGIFRSRDTRRSFLAGFVATGCAATATLVWALMLLKGGIVRPRTWAEVPGTWLLSAWFAGYDLVFEAVMQPSFGDVVRLDSGLPTVIAARGATWSILLLLVASAGGLMSALIAGWWRVMRRGDTTPPYQTPPEAGNRGVAVGEPLRTSEAPEPPAAGRHPAAPGQFPFSPRPRWSTIARLRASGSILPFTL